MYHFRGIRNSVHDSKSLTLGADVQLTECHVSTLLDFQLEALRCAYACILEHDFFIYNDASGLGKIAVAAHLLGLISAGKKTLLILPNDADIVRSWLFHIDVLTKLKAHHIVDGAASFSPDYEIYLVSWTHLRYMDYSLFTSITFDYVLLDNRGAKPMLSNQFCRNMLIDRLEQRVNIILSTIDITIDEKLIYIILRLGARLPSNTLSFNAFKEEYKLPSLSQAQSNRTLLYMEEYLQKRDRLEALCRDFRLRRYCHNFHKQLPLCTRENFEESLQQWEAARKQQKTIIIKSQKQAAQPIKLKPALDVIEKAASLEDLVEREESVCMSPLVFETDSENEAHAQGIVCESSADIIELNSSAEEDLEIIDSEEEEKVEPQSQVEHEQQTEFKENRELRNLIENDKNIMKCDVMEKTLHERLSKMKAKMRLTDTKKRKHDCIKSESSAECSGKQRITRSSASTDLVQGLEAIKQMRKPAKADDHRFKKPRNIDTPIIENLEKKLPTQNNQLSGESSISSMDYLHLPCAQRMSASESPILMPTSSITLAESPSLTESTDLILPETAENFVSLITSAEEEPAADSMQITPPMTPRKRLFRKRKSTPRSLPPVNVLEMSNTICDIKTQQKISRITSPDLFSSSCDIMPAPKLPAAQKLINYDKDKKNVIETIKPLSSPTESELNSTDAWTTNVKLSQKILERKKFLYGCESSSTSCASDSNDSTTQATIADNEKTPTSCSRKFNSRAGKMLAAALHKSRAIIPTSKTIGSQNNSPTCNTLTKWLNKTSVINKTPPNKVPLGSTPVTLPRRKLKHENPSLPLARHLTVRCRRLSLS